MEAVSSTHGKTLNITSHQQDESESPFFLVEMFFIEERFYINMIGFEPTTSPSTRISYGLALPLSITF